MTAYVVVTDKAPQHLIDQAYAAADFVFEKFGVTKITVFEDHVAYHDMVKPDVWDKQMDMYTRRDGKDVLRTEADVPVSCDQVPKANVPKKRKK